MYQWYNLLIYTGKSWNKWFSEKASEENFKFAIRTIVLPHCIASAELHCSVLLCMSLLLFLRDIGKIRQPVSHIRCQWVISLVIFHIGSPRWWQDKRNHRRGPTYTNSKQFNCGRDEWKRDFLHRTICATERRHHRAHNSKRRGSHW